MLIHWWSTFLSTEMSFHSSSTQVYLFAERWSLFWGESSNSKPIKFFMFNLALLKCNIYWINQFLPVIMKLPVNSWDIVQNKANIYINSPHVSNTGENLQDNFGRQCTWLSKQLGFIENNMHVSFIVKYSVAKNSILLWNNLNNKIG